MEKQPQGGIRRLVTGHDQKGKEAFQFDDEAELLDLTAEHATFAVVWTTDSAPADNTDDRDGALKPVWSGTSHNKNGGSVLRFVDFPPHVESPMHRTQSLDYGIVIWGEIEVHLKSGEHRLLRQSDVCVQRGTDHLWKNNTDKWTRVAFILLDADAILIDGNPLPDKGFSGDKQH
ncbi:hypothetical protein CBS101457_005010 [Exobasidium rhododendri]|nr:hypothetical protein CBS101457_005010 [Exobasidium rhododendri]